MIERAQLDRWMAAAADGDRAALEPLFAALSPVVTRYAARFLGDPALGEDAAQEALVRLFGRLDRYDRTRDALTWALTHATWECRTVRRRVQRRREVAEVAAIGGAGEERTHDGAGLAEDRELVRAAVATLETLAPRDAEVIVAAITDDDELRRTLEPATFRKRLERALARLRTSWRSRHGTL
ncbi:MAG: sigma-70 family RNA polymerase sigma factor [Deltaproteobacteria bacterium]|nr:sigma-70 family RNA polymerase sigma factor [Deltaproteobacteria bacterium]